MKFLLIGGQPDSGKTQTLIRLYLRIYHKYTKITNVHPNPRCTPPTTTSKDDFSVILDGVDLVGNPIKILLHSPSDDMDNINLLEANIKTHSPDIVVTSVRDIDWQRHEIEKRVATFGSYKFEIPLARITRRGKHSGVAQAKFFRALSWYQTSIDTLIDSVLNQPPFNI